MKRLLLLAAALFVVVGASAASRKLKNSDTEKFQYELYSEIRSLRDKWKDKQEELI